MTERDFQQPPGTRYRLLQSMYRNKTSIIWPLIASFAASSFFVTALVVVIFLFIAMAYQAATQPSVESLSFALAEWVQARPHSRHAHRLASGDTRFVVA